MSMIYKNRRNDTMKKENHIRAMRFLMVAAWTLARQGARRFGGSPSLYFVIALRLVWRESKPRTVWHAGLGNMFLLPGLPVPTIPGARGQFSLPGIGK